jgi:hypothetical protein
VFEDLPSDVAFQTAHDLYGVETFCSAAGDVAVGLLMIRHAG